MRRKRERIATSTPLAEPTRARIAVGFSGELTQPDWAIAGAATTRRSATTARTDSFISSLTSGFLYTASYRTSIPLSTTEFVRQIRSESLRIPSLSQERHSPRASTNVHLQEKITPFWQSCHHLKIPVFKRIVWDVQSVGSKAHSFFAVKFNSHSTHGSSGADDEVSSHW